MQPWRSRMWSRSRGPRDAVGCPRRRRRRHERPAPRPGHGLDADGHPALTRDDLHGQPQPREHSRLRDPLRERARLRARVLRGLPRRRPCRVGLRRRARSRPRRVRGRSARERPPAGRASAHGHALVRCGGDADPRAAGLHARQLRPTHGDRDADRPRCVRRDHRRLRREAGLRLYLSSFRMGDRPERLVELVEPGRRAAVVANAMDDASPEVREEGVQRELVALAELGLDVEELDLREYFDPPGRIAAELRRYGLVWLRGGNVFMLRFALATSGADAALVELLRRDELVYAGYSAGPCVLGPTLRGFEDVDDPAAVEAVHGAPPVWEGLGVLDYVIVPHVDSPGHPETERCEALAERYRIEGVPHRTLRDGEAIVIDSRSRG